MSIATAPTYYEYPVRPGDSLSRLIATFYGYTASSPNYAGAKDHLLALNPDIRNPDRLYVGQILRVAEYPPPSIFTTRSRTQRLLDSLQAPDLQQALNGQSFITQPVHPVNHGTFWALTWLEHHGNWLTIPGGIALGATQNLMSPGNRSLIEAVADLYADYQQNKLTKGQYDARRKALLTRFKQNIGPIERLLFGNRTTHQAIRIAKAGGIPATAHIAKHAQRIKTLATVGKMGGFVLTGVGVTAACMQIAHTQDKKKKNEILVETVASTIVGGATGVAVGIFLLSNPVGWGTALVLAVGSAVVSYGAGNRAVWAYNALGSPVDFVNGTGLNSVCR